MNTNTPTVRSQDYCPACNRLIALYADGTLYRHGPWGNTCPGSHQPATTTPVTGEATQDAPPADEGMSPTAQAVIAASAARDAAVRAAWEAEGTDREAELDAAEKRAEADYQEACKAHRAAREAWDAQHGR